MHGPGQGADRPALAVRVHEVGDHPDEHDLGIDRLEGRLGWRAPPWRRPKIAVAPARSSRAPPSNGSTKRSASCAVAQQEVPGHGRPARGRRPARAATSAVRTDRQDRQAPPPVEHPVEERVVGVVVVVGVAGEALLRRRARGARGRRRRRQPAASASRRASCASTSSGVVVGGDEEHRLVEREQVVGGAGHELGEALGRVRLATRPGTVAAERHRYRSPTMHPGTFAETTPDKPAVIMDDGRRAHLPRARGALEPARPPVPEPPAWRPATTSPSCSRTGPSCSSWPGRRSAPGSTTRPPRPG